MKTIFKEINRQNGYLFIFSEEMLKNAKPVDIHVVKGSLEEVLRICFNGQPLAYQLIGKTIVVKSAAVAEAAPPSVVRGKIVNEKGQPIRLNAGTGGKAGRRKLSATDWDGDGKLDLLLNSANANFLRQVDSKDGNWVMRDEGSLSTKNIEGHDVSPTTVDWDGNGISDLLSGAEDGRFYFLQNPRAAK